MSRFEPLWKRDYRNIDTRLQEFWKGDRFDSATPKEQISAKAIDEFLDMLRKDKQLKDALNFIEAMRLQNLIRTKVNEEEWIDLNLPHFSIGGVQIDFVDTMNDVHHGYYDIGGFHNAKGQVVPIKCVNRWRYARVKREPAPAWKPIDLDNPPVGPVLLRFSSESTPFVTSDINIYAGCEGWEYCEIPE